MNVSKQASGWCGVCENSVIFTVEHTAYLVIDDIIDNQKNGLETQAKAR